MKTQAAFIADSLAAVPGAWRRRVEAKHAGMMAAAAQIVAGTGRRSDAEAAANLFLLDTAERMREIRIPLSSSDDDLCKLAAECAAEAASRAAAGGAFLLSDYRTAMAAFAVGYGITPPGPSVTDTGAVKRMGCAIWWRRRLRVAQGRAIEREAIRLGYVHKRREIYASTATVERRAQQKKRNALSLEKTTATNQNGDEFTLAELAARSVANPRIRRGELMTRIAGFEAVARGLEHVGLFFTLTTPSRMHAKKQNMATKAVFDNPKYDQTTPRQAQQYLVKVWARVRAALARIGAAVYGFRIAEPHHDATPHWHLLLFMAPGVAMPVYRLFAKHARREDRAELDSKAAKKARFFAKVIDWARGSAAGYIAKYVSKNIDGGGYQVQGDIHGQDHAGITPSHRVEAWAAAWGIRQFQQIGGAPVGVWRELRRMKESAEHGATLAAARLAADVGAWDTYIRVMGLTKPLKTSELIADRAPRWSKPSKHGVSRPLPSRVRFKVRKHWPVKVAVSADGERFDADKGAMVAAPQSRYGEASAGAVWGVSDFIAGADFVTRVFKWEVKRNGRQESSEAGKGMCHMSKEVRSGNWGLSGAAHVPGVPAGGVAEVVGFELGFDLAGLAPPWTSVNNCTQWGIDDDSDSGIRVAQEGFNRTGGAEVDADSKAGPGAGRRNGRHSGRPGAGRCRSSRGAT